MSLAFEESLTLEALRAFVAATKRLSSDRVVEIGSAYRAGHEEVVTITARHSTTGCWAVDGPQPELTAAQRAEARAWDSDAADAHLAAEGDGEVMP
ncbi:hypothetical protein [Nocardia sp. NPDC004711]